MKKLLVKLYGKNGKTRVLYTTSKTKRILSTVSQGNFQKAYVRVGYGKKKCIDGCLCEFHNDGYYTSTDDTKEAIQIFWREE